MRLIAQMTIYNSGDFERLRQFIEESYHPDLLAQELCRRSAGDLSRTVRHNWESACQQVVATGKHHVVVVMETEREEGYLVNEMEVEEDYPHRIIVFGDVD